MFDSIRINTWAQWQEWRSPIRRLIVHSSVNNPFSERLSCDKCRRKKDSSSDFEKANINVFPKPPFRFNFKPPDTYRGVIANSGFNGNVE